MHKGKSQWRFTADFVLKNSTAREIQQRGHVSRFNLICFDQMQFDSKSHQPFNKQKHWQRDIRTEVAHFAFDEPVINLNILAEELTLGTFMAVIPWHLPGFTDQFAEDQEHPQHYIQSIINRVKASGVQDSIAYKQGFVERHDLGTELHLKFSGEELNEYHDMETSTDTFFITGQQANCETQDMADHMILDAMFNYTRFYSLNKFGSARGYKEKIPWRKNHEANR